LLKRYVPQQTHFQTFIETLSFSNRSFPNIIDKADWASNVRYLDHEAPVWLIATDDLTEAL